MNGGADAGGAKEVSDSVSESESTSPAPTVQPMGSLPLTLCIKRTVEPSLVGANVRRDPTAVLAVTGVNDPKVDLSSEVKEVVELALTESRLSRLNALREDDRDEGTENSDSVDVRLRRIDSPELRRGRRTLGLGGSLTLCNASTGELIGLA